ncbi:MAG TPA: hypothetical protein VMV24_01425 [Candidatus Dormibacteraeota bacterium]|nr:hypothetical protein [Candidatus Dormibacteraeota bacterium]
MIVDCIVINSSVVAIDVWEGSCLGIIQGVVKPDISTYVSSSRATIGRESKLIYRSE